jgi:hypothetical protein
MKKTFVKSEVRCVADDSLELLTYRKKSMRKTKYTMDDRLWDYYRQYE